MAQHDQIIDNGPGLAVRTDINAALAALFSTNSGAVEPTVKVAGQLWFDTSVPATPRVKVRNGGNTAWVVLLELDAIDMGFGKKASPNRYVVNTKADMTGADNISLEEAGIINAVGKITGAGIASTNGVFEGSGGALMTLDANGLALPAGSDMALDTLRLLATIAASLTSTGHGLQIGATSGANLRIDTNGILTANNGIAGGALFIANGIDLGVPLGVADGGTGATTAAAGLVALGGAPLTTDIIAGNGLTGGGSLAADRTLAVGTPSTLTATTTNTVGADTHAHDVDAANVASAGNAALAVGSTGTYALLQDFIETRDTLQGATRAGSELRYANTAGQSSGTAPAGTWRVMGWTESNPSNVTRASVWLRI